MDRDSVAMSGRFWGRRVGMAVVLAAAVAGTWDLRPAGAATTVNFGIQYQDYSGAAHPLINLDVNFLDALNSTQFAGPLNTDGNGQVSLVTAYANVDGANNLEVQPVIVARIPNVAAAYLNAAAANPYSYMPGGSGFYGATKDATTNYLNVSFNNSNDAIKTFAVLEYIKFMHDFYGNAATYNAAVPNIRVNYSPANAGSSMGGGVMTLGYVDWGNIDVIMHEYGHHVAENNALEGTTLGLAHTFDTDNISANNGGQNYGNLNGSKIAWQEGIATYLGMVALAEGNTAAAFPRVPNGGGLPADASNATYDSYAPAANQTLVLGSNFAWSVSINSLQVQVGPFDIPDPDGDFGDPTDGNPPSFRRGKGEGDEMSVMRTLWDFEQNTNVEAYARAGQQDLSHYGGTKIFSVMQGVATNKGTMYGFWQAITSDVRTATGKPRVGLAATDPDAEAVMRLGMTLEQNAISGIPLTIGEQPNNTPTITWTEQNNLNSLLFKVLIYSSDWKTLKVESGQIAKGVDSFTVPNPLASGDYEYVILNSPMLASAADLTGSLFNWYWSGDSTFTVPDAVPEPGTLVMLGLGGFLMLRRRRAA